MRIYIKYKRGVKLPIPLPLLFIKWMMSLATSKYARRHIPAEHKIYFDWLADGQIEECLDLLKGYKGLKLVEVKTWDGIEIIVKA